MNPTLLGGPDRWKLAAREPGETTYTGWAEVVSSVVSAPCAPLAVCRGTSGEAAHHLRIATLMYDALSTNQLTGSDKMRPSQFRRFFNSAALAAIVAAAGATFPGPAFAQGDTGMARTTRTGDRDQDWGWIGLLGLAGLLGLRRRTEHGVDTVRRP
jgi:MYXO-CTERM domain-containing protein